jgi:hypothetical protein
MHCVWFLLIPPDFYEFIMIFMNSLKLLCNGHEFLEVGLDFF